MVLADYATRCSSRTDHCTYSKPEEAACKHLRLDWSVDFDAKTLAGSAEWDVELLAAPTKLHLDTKSLAIKGVTVDGATADFELGDTHEAFGQRMSIALPAGLTTCKVKVEYSTSPSSTAVQWLAKETTAGGVHPYVFTQCEAIHARALLPCPDTPSAKFSYEASVAVPSWATAVMSALGKGSKRKADGETATYYFEQPVVIPAYLLAIAVGQLQSKEVGPRSRVWAEPSVVDAAAYEFGQAEQFIGDRRVSAARPPLSRHSTVAAVEL